jgi:hypothetical protein
VARPIHRGPRCTGPAADATALERASEVLSRNTDLAAQLARQSGAYARLQEALRLAEEELSQLKEHTAAIAPQQQAFFAQQRGVILRHLVQSIRLLRGPKRLLERIVKHANSSTEDLLADAAEASAVIASVRRGADYVVMKCFTAHERSEIDVSDAFVIEDTSSIIARSPSTITRHTSVGTHVDSRSPSSVLGR